VYVGPHSKNIDDGPIKMAPYEKKKEKTKYDRTHY
jgi:hypothetical protein